MLVRIIDFIVFLGHLVLYPFASFKSRSASTSKKIKVKLNLQKIKYPKRKWKIGFPKMKIDLEVSRGLMHFLLGIFTALVFIVLPIQVYGWYRDLPSPGLLAEVTNKSTKILDRNGKLLYEIYIDRNYDPVDLSQIPDHMIKATLAIEDDKFYSHLGLRFQSTVRAAWNTLGGGEVQGGSTITQQLVKNVLLSPERTISRKVREAVLAVMVEMRYTKDEILEMYLNNIPYGGTAWGVQSASQKFFGKSVADLNLAEASFLAGLPSAPTSFSPFNGGNERAKARQKLVLDRMVELGFTLREEADAAYAAELIFNPQEVYVRAPHFVSFVRSELEKEYGPRMVNSGGLTVTTTLDLDLQERVQEIVTKGVADNAWLSISNGAAVVLDSQSGEILAYVGSVDYFSDTIDGKFDVVTAFRQPGSSIKPVTYSLAFQNGFTPATIIEDEKVTFTIPGQPSYTPVNYDGKYHGKVTVRQALANSYNIPAVKVAARLGADKIVEFGKQLGLTGWESGDGSYGISVTLGGKEVRLLDLANVYATLSRGGVLKQASPFLSISDAKGHETLNGARVANRVMPETVSYLVTNILADSNARTPAFGTNSWLNVAGHTVAVKTGTTDQKRDNWTFGYTPSYAVGVWVGNNDNTPLNPNLASGLSGAAPIWHQIMTAVLADVQPEKFPVPSTVFVKTDEDCDNKSEIFIKGTAPERLCDPDDKDKEGGDN